ncbi:uncharacterized protein LOC130713097 [Lotus japonicus]|uniref:uncharacterized protein LOC130713097 n=1 Tax=Lotus japonicus TaxID=34305 RepID=UPI0025890C92|nr:uncharacterized protein LOC130713097 [Lotus japonicus]
MGEKYVMRNLVAELGSYGGGYSLVDLEETQHLVYGKSMASLSGPWPWSCVRDVPSRGGLGGCFRSTEGKWMGGFFGYRDDACILHLELLGIHQGLTLAWERGYRVVECQSDSLDAVNLILSVPPSRHLYASLIWDIKDLLSRTWMVKLHHTLREGNACADFLAKHGASQNEALVLVEQPVAALGLLLLADAAGVSFVRP